MKIKALFLFFVVISYSMSASAMLSLRVAVARAVATHSSRALVPYAGYIHTSTVALAPGKKSTEQDADLNFNGGSVRRKGEKYFVVDGSYLKIMRLVPEGMKLCWKEGIHLPDGVFAVPFVQEKVAAGEVPVQFIVPLKRKDSYALPSVVKNYVNPELTPSATGSTAKVTIYGRYHMDSSLEKLLYLCGWPGQAYTALNYSCTNFISVRHRSSVNSRDFIVNKLSYKLVASFEPSNFKKLTAEDVFFSVGGFNFTVPADKVSELQDLAKSSKTIVASIFPPFPEGSLYAGLAPCKLTFYSKDDSDALTTISFWLQARVIN